MLQAEDQPNIPLVKSNVTKPTIIEIEKNLI